MTLRIDQHIHLANNLKDAKQSLDWVSCFLPINSPARRKAYKTLRMLDDLCLALENQLASEVPADLDPRGLLPCIYMGTDIHTFSHPDQPFNFRDRFHGWVVDEHRSR